MKSKEEEKTKKKKEMLGWLMKGKRKQLTDQFPKRMERE